MKGCTLVLLPTAGEAASKEAASKEAASKEVATKEVATKEVATKHLRPTRVDVVNREGRHFWSRAGFAGYSNDLYAAFLGEVFKA